MYTYITNISVRGIKNLKNEINLTFYDKTIKPNINLDKTNIKAIYGANGSGKSAIIYLMEKYKNIISKSGYLYSDRGALELDELLNKESTSFEIKLTFLYFDENDKIHGRFRHELVIARADDEFLIASEKLIQIKTRTEETFVEISNGNFLKKNISDILVGKSINQLTKKSIIEVFFESSRSASGVKQDLEDRDYTLFIPFVLLGRDILVNTIEEDKHNFYIYHKWLKTNAHIPPKEKEIQQSSKHSFKLKSADLNEFEQYIFKLNRFIKIFKTDLDHIELEKKYNVDEVIVEPYFDYGKYKIHLEFESAGIKKLVELFSFFCAKEKGAIVFIDELDSSINDIYLIKLIEHFKQSNIGQLVFTSHNVSPMRALFKNRHALDFITENGEIVEWRKDGNYAPDKVYQNGLIKGLPFNIDSFDFIGMFSDID